MSSSENTRAPNKKQVPIREGFFKWPTPPQEEPHLLGSKCKKCGEVFFPRRERCMICFSEDMEDVALSRKGKIYSYTVIPYATPGYTGAFPSIIGAVELLEGIIILSPLTECNPDELKVGMDVELVLEKQHEDKEGNEVITYKFRPRPR